MADSGELKVVEVETQKKGRPRKEETTLRSANAFRFELTKNSRYSSRVSVSLQPSSVGNLDRILQEQLSAAETSKAKNKEVDIAKLRGLIAVWEELRSPYICQDGKERIKSYLSFKEAYETFKAYDTDYIPGLDSQYDTENFQRALLHPRHGLCIYIVNLPVGERCIIIRSDECDMELFFDFVFNQENGVGTSRLPLNAEFVSSLLASMDSEWDQKVARVLIGASRSGQEIRNLGIREGDINTWRDEVLEVCKESENAKLAAERIVRENLQRKLTRTKERIQSTESKVSAKEGIWQQGIVDDLREQIEIDKERCQEYEALLAPADQTCVKKLKQMRKRQAEQIMESNRLKRRRITENVGRPLALDSDDEEFVAKAVEEKATYHGRRHDTVMYTNKRVKVRDLAKIANHKLRNSGKRTIRSVTTVWNRSAPRNKRSIQGKRHKFKGLFCTKKPPKTEDRDNENTHHQRAHVRNVQLRFFSQKTAEERKYVFVQSMDDKAYVRPGTSEGFSKARNVKIVMPSSESKQRKLPKYDFAENTAFVTPSTHRILHKKGEIVDGSEKLISEGDRHFVFTRPKAVVDSSGTTWANENVLLCHSHREEFDIYSGTENGSHSQSTRNFLRHTHDVLFQYKDMSVKEDLASVDPADPACRYKQYEILRLKHLKSHLEMATVESEAHITDESEKALLSNRLIPLINMVKDNINTCTELYNDSTSSKDAIIDSCNTLLTSCNTALDRIQDIGLPSIKPRWSELTDAGPGVSVTNFDVQTRVAELCRLWNLDYYIRLHRSRGDSGQNEAERTNSAIGDAMVDGGTINWEYYPMFHGLTDEEIQNLTVEDHARNEVKRKERNAWRVAEEIAERINGAPVLGEFIESQLTPNEDVSFFFNTVYVKEYQQSSASARPTVPGYHYMKKLETFNEAHVQTGELYLEFLRESCASANQGDCCEYCRNTEWHGPVMARIPRPFPDRANEGHYLDVFSTPNTNDDGTEREIDDFLPRARVKKLFAAGELKINDHAKLAELAKELSLPISLLEECVKHLEELKILSEMRSKDRARKREEREAKTYNDYNWPELIRNGSLNKLIVKELDKYMNYHQMPHRNMTKEDKVRSITYHFYQSNPDGEHSIHSEDETSSEDDSSSDGGSDIVLNEIDDDETDEVDLPRTRRGRLILDNRSADSDWLFY